jgi:hypothetical protein
MPADQGLVDSVSNANIKTIAEAGAHAMAQIFQSSAAHANRLNILAEGALAKSLKNMQELDVSEAVSEQKVLSGNDLGQVLASLNAAVAAAQQLVKGAGNTPPVTP